VPARNLLGRTARVSATSWRLPGGTSRLLRLRLRVALQALRTPLPICTSDRHSARRSPAAGHPPHAGQACERARGGPAAVLRGRWKRTRGRRDPRGVDVQLLSAETANRVAYRRFAVPWRYGYMEECPSHVFPDVRLYSIEAAPRRSCVRSSRSGCSATINANRG